MITWQDDKTLRAFTKREEKNFKLFNLRRKRAKTWILFTNETGVFFARNDICTLHQSLLVGSPYKANLPARETVSRIGAAGNRLLITSRLSFSKPPIYTCSHHIAGQSEAQAPIRSLLCLEWVSLGGVELADGVQSAGRRPGQANRWPGQGRTGQ